MTPLELAAGLACDSHTRETPGSAGTPPLHSRGHVMGQSAKQHLSKLLESFDTAMLITKYGDGDHARPMAIAEVDGASTIWFVTSTASPKLTELSRDSRVAVTCQSDKKYVAL